LFLNPSIPPNQVPKWWEFLDFTTWNIGEAARIRQRKLFNSSLPLHIICNESLQLFGCRSFWVLQPFFSKTENKKKNKKKRQLNCQKLVKFQSPRKKKRCSPKNRLKFNDNHWSSWPFPVHLYYLQLMECDNRTRQLNSIIQLKTRVHQHSTAGDQYSTSVTFSPNSLVFLSSPSSWNYPTISQPSLSFLPIFFPFTKKKKINCKYYHLSWKKC